MFGFYIYFPLFTVSSFCLLYFGKHDLVMILVFCKHICKGLWICTWRKCSPAFACYFLIFHFLSLSRISLSCWWCLKIIKALYGRYQKLPTDGYTLLVSEICYNVIKDKSRKKGSTPFYISSAMEGDGKPYINILSMF